MAFLLVLIALAVGAYYYFKDPQKAPEKIRATIHDVRAKTGKAIETGEQVYKKSKDAYRKSRKMVKETRDFFKNEDQETDQGQ